MRKLNENPFDLDLKEFHSEIELFEDYFDEKTMRKFDPNHGLKKFYAKIKTHKTDWPVRPMVFSINSITVGTEETILKNLEALNRNPSKSINNTKLFKIEFQKHKHKFNLETH